MAAGDPHGLVLGGWEPVREAFADNLSSGRDVGAGVAVYHRGQLVVDLRGGFFDRSRMAPYAHDTLQLVFSTTKGVTAIAVGMCVDRRLLNYDEKVSAYWPEFAAAGKGDITVSQLLSHQAGLFSVDAPVTLADALEKSGLTQRQVSDRLGVSAARVSQFFNAEGNPTVRSLAQFADAMNCKVAIQFVPLDYDVTP